MQWCRGCLGDVSVSTNRRHNKLDASHRSLRQQLHRRDFAMLVKKHADLEPGGVGLETSGDLAPGLLGAWELRRSGATLLETWNDVTRAVRSDTYPVWVHVEGGVEEVHRFLEQLWDWSGIEWVLEGLLNEAFRHAEFESEFHHPTTGNHGFVMSLQGVDLQKGKEVSDKVSLRLLCTDSIIITCRYHSIMQGGTSERKLRDVLQRCDFTPLSTIDIVALVFRDISSHARRELESLDKQITDIEHELHGMRVGASYYTLRHVTQDLAEARFKSACIRRFIVPQNAELIHLVNSRRRRIKVRRRRVDSQKVDNLHAAQLKHQAVVEKLESVQSLARVAQDLLSSVRQENIMNTLSWLALIVPFAIVFHGTTSWLQFYLKKDKQKETDPWDDPRNWGLSYEQLKEFEAHARSFYGSRFTEINMRDVVNDLLQPMCQSRGVSYARLQNEARPLPVQAFVTHCWDEPFEEFCNSITNTFHHNLVKPNMFICAFALNQASIDSISVQLGDTIETAPFVSALEASNCLVVCRNRTVDLYSRGWCLIEVLYGMKFGLVPSKVHVTGPDTFSDRKTSCVDVQAAKVTDRVKILKCILNEGCVEEIDERINQFRSFAPSIDK